MKVSNEIFNRSAPLERGIVSTLFWSELPPEVVFLCQGTAQNQVCLDLKAASAAQV
jgi:hypothetical protein